MGGGRLGGVWGGFRPWGGGFPRWGGLRATHYYHMHTSWGVVCLGVGGYGGMYPAFSGVPNKGNKIKTQNLSRGSP